MIKNFKIFLFTSVTSLLILQSCSVKKFIPEDKLLYTGAELIVNDTVTKGKEYPDVIAELEAVLTPEPNTKFLGMRPGLYFYYKAQRVNPGFINKFLNKKIGEEPVYLSDVELNLTEDLLLNRLENRGFFYSTATSRVNEKEEKKVASVVYEVNITEPYTLATYQLDSDSLLVYKRIENFLPESPIEDGMRFDLAIMKFERERLDNKLKNEGFYNFNPGFLIFEADTNQYDQKKFDLYLRLKEEVPPKSIIPYRIAEVNVYPNYVLPHDTIAMDTVRYKGRIYLQEEEFFKPKHLDPYLLIEEGEFYDPTDSRNTSRRLASIGAYKFVNITYEELDTNPSDSLGFLQANIFLSPLNKRSVRAELQGVTKSNNFAGPHFALTYSNRNLFHGGEILSVTGKFGYEVQMAGGDLKGLSSFMFGVQTDLIFPRLLFPIQINDNWFEYSIPKTRISLGGDYITRSKLYSLASLSARFGYIWAANRFITHELNPLSLNIVRLMNTTPEFQEILDQNPFLESSFQQQFISGLTYSFTYNGMIDADDPNQFFLNSTVELAGNTINLFKGKNNGERGKLFGLEYAQFSKVDADFRYHRLLGNEQKLATRFFAGVGFPYGNSDVMPFSRQYYAGGPYSVRAFRIRSLGPGAYDPESSGNIAYFDQSGSVRLEANVEYRFPIYSFFKGAVFADAGNVWNLEGRGEIGSDFISELGIGAGAGLRVDIQNFVIRFDLAFPLHVPYLPEGERWVFGFDEPVLNFAVGYPF